MTLDVKAERISLNEHNEINGACATRVSDYLARAGLFLPDFAQRAGFDEITLRAFMRGDYHKCAHPAPLIVARLTDFMNAHPAGDSTPFVGELYETANVRTIRDTFQKLIPRPVAYLIYAPPGSQKTFVLEHEVARLNGLASRDGSIQRAFYVYARKDIRPRDMVRRICIACGSRTANDVDPMLEALRYDFRHCRVLLVIDEAQHLSIDCFDTIRELLDQTPHFSLLFAGSHDLKRKLDQFSATLEQLNSRIIDKVRLPGLEKAEAMSIIHGEIGELLDEQPPEERKLLVDGLIAAATARDTFENNRSYINVRTLTNAISRVSIRAAEKKAKAGQ